MAAILAPNAENIRQAAKLLREGQVVAMPTETVYGLAGIVFNEIALTRIFKTKERPTFDPLIVHVLGKPSLSLLEKQELIQTQTLSKEARQRAEKLMQTYWPGPLTLVLPKNPRVPDLATSGLATVAVRMPRHPVAQALLREVGAPLAAPSANRFGRISPTTAAHVQSELGDRIEMILEGGPCDVGLESTVVAIDAAGQLMLLRPGAITRAQLQSTTNSTVEIFSGATTGGASPGMLASHYAPAKRLRLLPTRVALLSNVEESTKRELLADVPAQVGLLVQQGDETEAAAAFEAWAAPLAKISVAVRVLSPSGNLEESARRLFSELRALDESPVGALFAEPCASQEGLGHAISDRLKRASR